MTTWRIALEWDPSVFVLVEGCQYAFHAFALARPLLQQKIADGPERWRDRQASFSECDCRQLDAKSEGPGLKSARTA